MAGIRIPEGLLSRFIGLKPGGLKPGGIKPGNPGAAPNIPLTNSVPQLLEKVANIEKAVIEKAAAIEDITQIKDLFRQAAATLGLPKDSLSAAILVFMRFFSLPLEPALIMQLRRDILASGKTSSPESPKESSALEAEALAAVIAEDKGVKLSPEALQRYAAYLVPPEFPGPGGREEKDHERQEAPTKDELQALAEKDEQEDGLLDILNSLPGKNAQYWMVFPFTVSIKGTELRVFVRILKKEFIFPGEGDQIIADISGPKRQWRCFLNQNNGKYRADIRVYPHYSPRGLKLLQREAERFFQDAKRHLPGVSSLIGKPANSANSMNSGFQEILVQNGNEFPSWLEDLAPEYLPSVNKDI